MFQVARPILQLFTDLKVQVSFSVCNIFLLNFRTIGSLSPNLEQSFLDKEKSSLFRCFSHRGDEREIANIPRQLL